MVNSKTNYNISEPTFSDYQAAEAFVDNKLLEENKYAQFEDLDAKVSNMKYGPAWQDVFQRKAEIVYKALFRDLKTHVFKNLSYLQELEKNVDNVNSCTGRTNRLFLLVINLILEEISSLQEQLPASFHSNNNEESKCESEGITVHLENMHLKKTLSSTKLKNKQKKAKKKKSPVKFKFNANDVFISGLRPQSEVDWYAHLCKLYESK